MTGLTEIDAALAALLKVREYLSDESHWLKGHAGDGNGRFCILGAVAALAGADETMLIYHLCDEIAGKFGYVTIPNQLVAVAQFNDDRNTTHADLLAFLDLAIEERIRCQL